MHQRTDTAIDRYIARYPPSAQYAMKQVREAIREVAPAAAETIKYGMPAFTLMGNRVYFAGYKKHIGFYPAPVSEAAFAKALAGYKTGRGSVQFPLDQPMSLALVKRMVRYYLKKTAADKAKG